MTTDPLLAQSAVDRLTSAAHTLVIEGPSYRQRTGPDGALTTDTRAMLISHLQVVPCSWQPGGPITLASDMAGRTVGVAQKSNRPAIIIGILIAVVVLGAVIGEVVFGARRMDNWPKRTASAPSSTIVPGPPLVTAAPPVAPAAACEVHPTASWN